jgi:hypothetical protein
VIAFKDFLPVWSEASQEYESLESVLERVNLYVHDNGLRVINIETVVLPNIDETGRAAYDTAGSDEWCQVIRLWFEG